MKQQKMFLMTLCVVAGALLLATVAHAVYNAGCIKARCLDQCSSWGSSGACTSSDVCIYGDPQQPPPGTDFYSCNSLYNSTSTPSVTINFCSPDPTVVKPINCADVGSDKTCSALISCCCKDGGTEIDYCGTQNLGSFTDKDDC